MNKIKKISLSLLVAILGITAFAYAQPASQPFIAFLRQLRDVNTTDAITGSVLKYNATTGKWAVGVDEGGAEATGDVTGVGDCAGGACLDGTSDGGTWIKFYDAQGVGQLITGNLTEARVWTLPDLTGTLLTVESAALTYQPLDADLTTYAGITPSANIQTLLGSADYSAARTNLGLAIGTNVQAYSADTTTQGNKVTLTQPANGSTLTIVDGKTLTATNTVNLNTMIDAKWCKYSTTGTALDCNVDPVTDTNTTYSATATGGLTFTGTAIGLTPCTGNENYIPKWNAATGWTCQADASGAGGGYTTLGQFVDQAAWKVFYSDGSGDVQELALGAANTYFTSAGATSAPTFGAIPAAGIAAMSSSDLAGILTDEDGSGDCGSGKVCYGDHTHTTYTAGGSTTELQRNNGGVLGGITGFTSNGTNLTGTGTLSMGTGVLIIPNTAAVTTAVAGSIGVDLTDDQLKYYGAAERVVPYKAQKCFALNLPVATDDNVPVFFPTDAITVTNMYCMTQGGTSAEIILSDGTNALDTMTCDADGQADDGNIANNTFTALERVEFDTGTVTGAVDWVTVCFTYTTTGE